MMETPWYEREIPMGWVLGVLFFLLLALAAVLVYMGVTGDNARRDKVVQACDAMNGSYVLLRGAKVGHMCLTQDGRVIDP